MKLILDVGNTKIKYGVYNAKHQLILQQANTSADFSNHLKILLKAYPQITASIVSASGKIDPNWIEMLSHHHQDVIQLSKQTPIPIQIDYNSLDTLGLDRIALAVAAMAEYPNQNCLVIDVGTCITYDFVSKNGIYKGGAISPGIEMRFKAMHTFTANLPLINKNDVFPKEYIGRNTKECLEIGVMKAVTHEIDGFVHQYNKEFTDLTVVLTGGNTHLLAGQLKNSIFANSNFQLAGLYNILIYNLNALKK